MRTSPPQNQTLPKDQDEFARWRVLHRARRDEILRNLSDLRTRLEEVLHHCLERDALTDWAECEGPGVVSPHHRTEFRALDRVEGHLAQISERLGGTFAGVLPADPAQAAALLAVDRELSQHAAALARCFEVPTGRHDFLVELDAELSDFERLLDKRAWLTRAAL